MYKGQTIGVVVPAYNEERFIASVINTMPDYIDKIYVVNDCSTDKTAEIVSKINPDGRLLLINHEVNKGVGGAIFNGYKRFLVDGIDIAVVMAGDGQMKPEYLPMLLDPVIEGKADYAVGVRLSSLKHMKGMSYLRRFGNWQLKWLTRIAAGTMCINDPQNGFTAITRQALERLTLEKLYPSYGYCNDMLVKLSVVKAHIKQIPIPAVYGSEKSKIRYWKYIPKVSWLLLRDFLWRIKVTWFPRS